MPLPTLKRALAIWFAIMLTESIHGTLRTLYLEPIMGGFRARQLSTVTATIIIFTITWFTMRWLRMLEGYDLTRGGMMGLGVTAMILIPWVVNRWRKEKH